ncbi:tetratricopeptide repeat protein [Dermacoccus nishinomiyaensis]|uniref:DUF6584 family protein n=1 Tax=Dermacoccus TaxID=57495 RepID=UPI0005876529|nr:MULTISPECIES: DUF6584 family protein [Dermacoccus]PZO98301.1 MAG: hypothetical protein DI618_11240 [Dermacoccus nishinomiyaensis]QQY25757.1 tetratricopeptide repeat protein [Dermacoccus nishinomiyaensis]TCJ91300.1 hypothetical protein EDC82_1041 [Dermacoccus sp. SAI-028]TJZ96931.1 tetratricopeptide repeat protein [Dermacoccus nishinomiyaensis]
MTALDRARGDIAQGRLWMARQRLTSYLVESPDDEVIALLAQVHLEMGDLPAAGALLFVLGRDDEVAREAIAAWRTFRGGPAAQWRSIPRRVRMVSTAPQVAQLRVEAGEPRRWHGDRAPQEGYTAGWRERAGDIGCGLTIVLVTSWSLFLMLWGAWSFSQWVLH